MVGWLSLHRPGMSDLSRSPRCCLPSCCHRIPSGYVATNSTPFGVNELTGQRALLMTVPRGQLSDGSVARGAALGNPIFDAHHPPRDCNQSAYQQNSANTQKPPATVCPRCCAITFAQPPIRGDDAVDYVITVTLRKPPLKIGLSARRPLSVSRLFFFLLRLTANTSLFTTIRASQLRV